MEIDHIAVAARQSDRLVERISAAVGLPILDGFRVGGEVRARGVRFANGVFLDVRQAPPEAPTEVGPPLLGLSGGVDEAEGLAEARGWRVKAQRRPDDPEIAGEPWSILSFRRGQGLLSSLFVIEYVAGARAAEDFSGPLYRPDATPDHGPALRRMWLAAREVDSAVAELTAMGFTPAGGARSAWPPGAGQLLTGARGDVVVCDAGRGVECLVRFDVGPAPVGASRLIELGPGLTMSLEP